MLAEISKLTARSGLPGWQRRLWVLPNMRSWVAGAQLAEQLVHRR